MCLMKKYLLLAGLLLITTHIFLQGYGDVRIGQLRWKHISCFPFSYSCYEWVYYQDKLIYQKKSSDDSGIDIRIEPSYGVISIMDMSLKDSIINYDVKQAQFITRSYMNKMKRKLPSVSPHDTQFPMNFHTINPRSQHYESLYQQVEKFHDAEFQLRALHLQ